MTRLWIIVNPAAAGGLAMGRWRRFERQLHRKGIRYERHFTERPSHATELARGAVEEGVERIAAFGGDGTLHEAAQAVAGSDSVLVFLPAGSSCDFAKDLPRRTALERLESGQTWARDLIRIECAGLDGGRAEGYAVSGANVGIVAEAAWRLNQHRWRGWSVDLAAVAAAVAAYRAFLPFDCEMHFDDARGHGRLLNLSVLKSDRLCGQMRLGAPARGDDGQLIAVTAAPAPLPGLLSALYRGKAAQHPAVTWRKCESVRVCRSEGVLVEADGEVIGRSPSFFSVAPRAIRVAV